ncbi:MAG: NADPH-dependent F420 reductase [Anaerolineales bacterium]|nr:NADPH-dependent F420 reductase [Anaerolineales bacterium]
MTATAPPTIAIIGGTGAEGSGLAVRWAAAGHRVLIGSRGAERAAEHAAALNAELAEMPHAAPISGSDNEDAAARADIVVLTVPYSAHEATLSALREAVQGKIVVDCTVPLRPPKVVRVQLPVAGSAGQEAQALLGDGVRVVSAFQNVSAHKLRDLNDAVNCDVLVTGNDPDARAQVIDLVEAAGMKGIHAGRIENAAAAEALTSLLIVINKRYGADGAGIKITNMPDDRA